MGPSGVVSTRTRARLHIPIISSFARGVVGSCLPTARELLPNMENCIPQQLGSSKAFNWHQRIHKAETLHDRASCDGTNRWWPGALSSLHSGVQGAGEGSGHRKVRSCCEALFLGGSETPQSPVKRYGSAVCGNKKNEMDDALSLISLSLSLLLACLLARRLAWGWAAALHFRPSSV